MDKSEAISISQLEELQTTIRAAGRRIAKAEEMARREGKKRTAAHVSAAVEIKRPCSVHYEYRCRSTTELEVSSKWMRTLPQSSLCCLKFWLSHSQQQHNCARHGRKLTDCGST